MDSFGRHCGRCGIMRGASRSYLMHKKSLAQYWSRDLAFICLTCDSRTAGNVPMWLRKDDGGDWPIRGLELEAFQRDG